MYVSQCSDLKSGEGFYFSAKEKQDEVFVRFFLILIEI